jgi:hypothetical protein
MRMSAGRIRSVNRRIARVNGIIFGAFDAPRRVFVESTKVPTAGIPPHTIKTVAVAEPLSA